MTAAATADSRLVRRRVGWTGAFLLVLALHGAALLSLRPGVTLPPDASPPAVLLDLAPMPVTPPAPAEAPPPPDIPLVRPVLPDETPLLPPLPVPPEPPPPLASVPQEAALPFPPPPAPPRPVARPAPRPPRPTPRPPAASPREAATPAPQAAPAPPAAASPTQAAQAPPSGHAGPAWQSALMARLARFRRYPPEAEQRGWRGVVTVRFAVDRQGNVLSVNVVRGSGHEMLDREAEAWIHRAQPMPKPPPEIPGSPVELQLPLSFELQDGE